MYALLALLTIAFAIECWAAHSFSPTANLLFALGGSSRDGVLAGEWFRILTATLLHGDVVHLLCNGVTLWIGGIFVEARVRGVLKECDCADHIAGNQQGRGQNCLGFQLHQHGIPRPVQVVHEQGAPALRGLKGHGRIVALKAQAAKTFGFESVGLFSDQIAIRRAAPEIDSARVKELAREPTKRLDQMTGVGALKCRAG